MFCGWGCRCGSCDGCRTDGWFRWSKRFSDPRPHRQPITVVSNEESMKRVNPGDQFKRTDPPIDDKLLASDFPTLLEYLTAVRYDDGAVRQTSTLLLFIDAGALKCCINDRDNNRSAFVTATDIMGILFNLEDGLANNTLDWRGKRGPASGGEKIPW